MKKASPTQGDVTLLQAVSGSQAYLSSNGHIKSSDAEDNIEDLNHRIQRLEKLLTAKTQKLNKMSQTLTQCVQLLRLSADDEHIDIDFDQQFTKISSIDSLDSLEESINVYQNEIIVRSPSNIKLDVQVLIGGKVPKCSFTYQFTAAKCSLLSDLRAQLVSAGSERTELQQATLWSDGHLLRLMKDLNHVTFRLQEDGHVARMNITPTKVDRSCAFPETEYEAWFYRNILRGNLKEYRVEVKIVV